MPRSKVLKEAGTTEILRILKNALEEKQDVLTIDNAVNSSSNNPVKNSGIYNAIQNLVSASYSNSVLTLTSVGGTTTTVAIPELDDVLISASYDTTTHVLTFATPTSATAYQIDLSQLYNPYTFADKVVSGKMTGFTVTDADGIEVYEYVDPSDNSDGSYATSSTLSTTIGATTSVAIANISGIDADEIVIGETLVYDAQGTVGNITAKNGTNVTVTTMTCAGHTIQDDTGTDMTAEPNLQFVNTKVTDDSTNGVTKVEVEKLTQADIDEIVDDLNYNPYYETFSTAETRVGTWIDGKPIYRKVINFTNTAPTTTWAAIPFTKPANMENVVECRFMRQPSGSDTTLGVNYAASVNFTSSQWIATGAVIACNQVILEYTKTTD